MTGIGSRKVLKYDMKKSASLVKRENTRVSKLLDINQAARCNNSKTCRNNLFNTRNKFRHPCMAQRLLYQKN